MTINVIPAPQSIQTIDGTFTINAQTHIQAAPGTESAATALADLLRSATGFPLPIESEQDSDDNVIQLGLHDGDPESYTLSVSSERVTIHGADAAGVFYGVQTLRQLLPPELESGTLQFDVVWELPALTIEDAPGFQWRGMHLDVCRHFYPVPFIKKFLDLMALHKFNVFHWHLTEDQGWRIEIKQYPRLIEVGSKRAGSAIPSDRTRLDGIPYEGHYTQDDVREIVAYAAARHITVVPEIEMPGHAVAVLASYPELGCDNDIETYEVRQFWGIADDVLCAGKDDVFIFMENVLNEVIDLFPSEFIHIGGDECPKVRWQECPRCQERIKNEGLKDEYELQSYFIRRIESFINSKGRRLVGWDEILEGGLAPNATVMSWRGSQGGIDAAAAGHDVVMTPNTHCYLDYYQTEDTDNEPPMIGNYLPIERVYQFNPVAGIPHDKHHHVLGGQGNVWTEYMTTSDLVEYMTYPRAVALAEALWTNSDSREFSEFRERLMQHLRRLDILKVDYRPLDDE